MKKIIVILTLFFASHTMVSQTLHLNELNGTETEYQIVDVRKIEFSASEVQVILFSGDTIFQPFNEFKNYQYNQSTLGVTTPDLYLNSFNVYPNPTQSTINFNFNSKTSRNYSYGIYDITGRMLFEQKIGVVSQTYSGTVSLVDYASGVYFLTIKSGDVKISKKIIKQ